MTDVQSALIPTPTITLDAASTIVDSALAHARELGCPPMTVVVLDSGGHLQVFKREDGSGILRPQIALAKAYGCLGMGLGGRALAERAAAHSGFYTALTAISDGRIAPAAGGVLVRDAAGTVVGAVGISGDKPDRDEACAVVGIERVGLVADTGGAP